ncbi:MAG TPA: glycosyltransferase [Thermoanaerobaculia bacterium]|nr:glycosyltransferase [Thermoanaerobaculia bacterium]
MNLLFVATKTPWPPADGGRLLLANTLRALADLGHRPALVAPVAPGEDAARAVAALSAWCRPHLVPGAPLGPGAALVRAWVRGEPFSIARHTLPAVGGEVERLLGAERFDIVHAEQLQALSQAAGAAAAGVPVVLRAQNVESDLWLASGRRREGWRGRWLAREGKSLAGWEGDALARVAAAVALSPLDADRLRHLAEEAGSSARVHVAPVPFPGELPPGRTLLAGDPAVVVLGSRGWLPNRDAAQWLAREIWPAVREALPAAVLHLFGQEIEIARGAGIESHEAPGDSAQAFAANAILAVPLRIASGVRMKVLEAWARGVPVVATPEALAGLDVRDGREALVARDPRGFTRAFAALHRDPELVATLVAGARRTLAERHAPALAARELLAVYADVSRRRFDR